MADESGSVVYTASYDPYGDVLSTTGEVQTNYGYTNEYTDSYFKLIDLRSRQYSPTSGRFLTKDSWQGNDTTPMSYNAWLYVDANPINLTDPSGQKIVCDNGYLGSCKDTPENHNFRNYSDSELLSYAQKQDSGSGCGPYSIAMALNLISGNPNEYTGHEIQDELERLHLKPDRLGMTPKLFLTLWAFQYYFRGRAPYYTSAGISDLKSALREDKLPVVVFANQSNDQILSDICASNLGDLTVGHYMVAVGFDNTSIKFLDPADASLHIYQNAEWTTSWASSNLFIPAGAMFVISPWTISFPPFFA
jgi:RHS repeat-associated protein